MKTLNKQNRRIRRGLQITILALAAMAFHIGSVSAQAQGKVLVDSQNSVSAYRIGGSGGRYRISFTHGGTDPVLVTYCEVFSNNTIGPEKMIQVNGRYAATTWVNTPSVRILHTEDMAPRRSPYHSFGGHHTGS